MVFVREFVIIRFIVSNTVNYLQQKIINHYLIWQRKMVEEKNVKRKKKRIYLAARMPETACSVGITAS